MLNVIFFVIFLLINIGLAKIDSNLIKKGKKIKHGLNAVIYFILLGIPYYFTKDWFLIGGLALLRIPIFNTFLNGFRGKELDYISDSTTSIIDKITNWIPKKIGYWVYNSIILLISLVLSFKILF